MLACSAALAVQQTVLQERLLDRVCERGAQLGSALHARFDGHPFVGDIRGRGLFWGVELVADRPAKRSFEPKRRTHVRVKAEAMKRDLKVLDELARKRVSLIGVTFRTRTLDERIPADGYFDDVHGSAPYKRHLTYYFAEQIRVVAIEERLERVPA